MTVKEYKQLVEKRGGSFYMSREEAMADMEGAELEAFKELTGGTQVSFITKKLNKQIKTNN